MTKMPHKSRKSVTRSPQTRDECATAAPPVRYVYAPLLQEFRGHTKKNEARRWIPVETNLIFRYEFAACSLQTRYIFVAIVLYMANNGIDEIPLDARFMSNVLNADYRTIEKSFAELLLQKLLLEKRERKEKEEEQHSTDRQESVSVCAGENSLFQNQEPAESFTPPDSGQPSAENDHHRHPSEAKTNDQGSQFSLDECRRYVEREIEKGAAINNAGALTMKLFKTGEADSLIRARLYPAQFEQETYGAARRFTDELCSVCYGVGVEVVDGRGARPCDHCRNEKGKSTGKEPAAAPAAAPEPLTEPSE